ncbi:MAG TPA: hypothetical protein VNL16_10355, partial [Chloroflexota bacterium]|nr:hypothetical protein [Chloroflexota bacterium]
MNQVAEDELEGDPYLLRQVAAHIDSHPVPAGGAIAGTMRAIDGCRALVGPARPARRRLAAWQAGIADLVGLLATASSEEVPGSEVEDEIRRRARPLIADSAALPLSVRRALLKMPSCFRSFDQRPEDVDR